MAVADPDADATDVFRNSSGKRQADPVDPVDRAIGRVAAGQRGVISRRQLLELGLRADHIDYRLRLGRLHALHRAVYAVGHDSLPREGRWLAAVLTSGPGAALSHRSAAAHWGIWGGAAGIHVTVPRQRRAQHRISLHHACIEPDEITVHDGIPTTGVSRTIFDLAPGLRPRQLERVLNDSERLRLTDALTLDDLLHRYPRRQGSARVRALLEARGAGEKRTRSDLEVAFLEFADAAGLPEPMTNQWIGEFELDVLWPDRALAVELDSWEHHSHRSAFESDRERLRVLQAAGIRCIPVTSRQLRDTPQALERDLRRLLAALPCSGPCPP